MASFHQFVAMRYLRGAHGRSGGQRFLRYITYVAIGGVAVGVASLLLALSIVRGFSDEIEAKIVGFGAHVQVESVSREPLDRAEMLQREMAQHEDIAHVAPVITEFALLRHSKSEIEGISIWGTDALPSYLTDHVIKGSGDFGADSLGQTGLVVGKKLADLLKVAVGDRVVVFSMRPNIEGTAINTSSGRPRARTFYVSGIFETSLADFDELYVFTDIAAARTLLNYGQDQVTRFDLTLNDVSQASLITDEITDKYGFPIMARSIYQVFRGLFAWVQLQESIIPLVVGVIILVASFNIVGIILMIIVEKSREIGVFASLGASAGAIQKLFVRLGLLIGSVGTIIGMILSLSLALIQLRFEVIPLPAEAYYMKTAPVSLSPWDFIIVGVLALALCIISSYIPARFASRIEPLRVIRFG